MLIDTRYAPKIPEGVDPYEVAPMLCAGVTVYKALIMTEAEPGSWVVISGIGGLGRRAVQYAVAMGFRVIAVDIADDKLELAKKHGAEIGMKAADTDPADEVQERVGGAHGVLVTAVHEQAFGQVIGMSRRGGTIVFNGLPAGIFDVVLNGLTVRGVDCWHTSGHDRSYGAIRRWKGQANISTSSVGRSQRNFRRDAEGRD